MIQRPQLSTLPYPACLAKQRPALATHPPARLPTRHPPAHTSPIPVPAHHMAAGEVVDRCPGGAREEVQHGLYGGQGPRG